MALRKIKLYGKIGQIFGKEWNLDVNSVSEAIRGIDINTKGEFCKYLLKNNKYYKVCVKNKKNTLSKEELCGNFGSGDIYISPVIRGSGKYGQIIAGVVMVAAAYFMGGFGAGATQGTAGSTALWGSYIGSVGIALTLGGIAQLLMTSKSKADDQRNSYLFQGNASTVYQGTAVGVVYGRALVSPMPVSIASDSQEINNYKNSGFDIGDFGDLGDVTSTMMYSYINGIAGLCGYDEFIQSSPPKKYRRKTMTGNWGGKNMGTSGQVTSTFSATLLGERHFDKYTCAESGLFHMCYSGLPCHNDYCSDSIYHWELNFYGVPLVSTTATTLTWSGGDQPFGWCCGDWPCDGSTSTGTTGGYEFVELSDEDTEADAIARFLNHYSWSPWSYDVVNASYEQRTTTGFWYTAVRVKTTTNKKYNPNINYNYSITYQRRLRDTTDPFVDAETITGSKRPNANGDIEFDIISVPGYDTRVGNITISL